MGKGVLPDDHPCSVAAARSLALREAGNIVKLIIDVSLFVSTSDLARHRAGDRSSPQLDVRLRLPAGFLATREVHSGRDWTRAVVCKCKS